MNIHKHHYLFQAWDRVGHDRDSNGLWQLFAYFCRKFSELSSALDVVGLHVEVVPGIVLECDLGNLPVIKQEYNKL